MIETVQESNRAVSSVVGIILVVAITVILAAVVAGIVYDVGESVNEEVQAGVSITVEHDPQYIDIQVTTLGSAEYVNITGDPFNHLEGGSSLEEEDFQELEVGESLRISENDLESDGESGTVAAVAVGGDRETLVTSQEYDFT
ncbi:type IV pilin [Natrarchaeobius halalkaliphilus]|uniref:Type IV pilin n=1 Tax=Natrarchaeobius halalkaliphilus TaxID=1679091 RepID=A0A3N6M041_9EURY|nr:type IV pilin N-terminal domain-containing protein [Natrarchaeobius halalkaliphilus]RQG88960.1 type IV pilin [Natrarchaeobius halalkaliphilus]